MPLSLRRLLVLLACLATAGAALAQKDYEPDSQVVNGHKWAVVKRLGTNLFGIPVAAGGLSADQRARTIADRRLDPLLGQGVLTIPENIEVGRMNGEVVIVVKNPQRAAGLPDPTLILTIDSAFERFMGRGRLDIAYYWRDLMRKWSRVGVMKAPAPSEDPAGRPFDAKQSWHQVPDGYAKRYTETAPASGDTGGGWAVPGE